MCLEFLPMNFVNSDQNNQEFDKSCPIVSYLHDVCKQESSFLMQPEGAKVPTTHYVPGSLGSLRHTSNETLACLQTVIPDFKAKHGVEKCHVSILTDGEAQYSRVWQKSEGMVRQKSMLHHGGKTLCSVTARLVAHILSITIDRPLIPCYAI